MPVPPLIASIPTSYGDARREYAALREGCGLDRVAARCLVHVEPENADAAIATLDVRPGPAAAVQLAVVRNADGLLAGCVSVIHRPTGPLLLDGSNPRVDRIIGERLGVARDGLGDTVVRIRLRGPSTGTVLASVGAPAPVASGAIEESAVIDGLPVIVCTTGADRCALYCDRHHARRIWDTIVTAGAVSVGSIALETVRIEDAEPCLERDFPGPVAVADAGFADLSHRPSDRVLVAVEHEGSIAFDRGTVLAGDGTAVGEVRVAAISVRRAGRPIAFALIDEAHASAGTILSLDGGVVRARAIVTAAVALPPDAASPNY